MFHKKRKWKQRNRAVKLNNIYDKDPPFFKTDRKPSTIIWNQEVKVEVYTIIVPVDVYNGAYGI